METKTYSEIEEMAFKLWQHDVMKLFNTNKIPEELSIEYFVKTEDHTKYFPKAEKAIEKKLRALKNKKYPVIEVPASGKTGWGGGAYTLCFVYSKHKGNFVLKGYYEEIQEYLKKNYTHYFCNFSLWHRGSNRDIWSFWKDGIGIFEPNNTRKRQKWEIRPYTCGYKDISLKESENKALYFKRLPKRWIPEFDKL